MGVKHLGPYYDKPIFEDEHEKKYIETRREGEETENELTVVYNKDNREWRSWRTFTNINYFFLSVDEICFVGDDTIENFATAVVNPLLATCLLYEKCKAMFWGSAGASDEELITQFGIRLKHGFNIYEEKNKITNKGEDVNEY